MPCVNGPALFAQKRYRVTHSDFVVGPHRIVVPNLRWSKYLQYFPHPERCGRSESEVRLYLKQFF